MDAVANRGTRANSRSRDLDSGVCENLASGNWIRKTRLQAHNRSHAPAAHANGKFAAS
jgi:hypothetical protein